MEWPDGGDSLGEPDQGAEQPSHADESIADAREPAAAADGGPGEPSHAPRGEDEDAALWADVAVDAEPDGVFERWLADAPAGETIADPASDDWLGEALGAVPPIPDDCLSTGELIDRVVAQRLADELGL